ncbi:hypothetical protein [Luteococcus sp.]|uniref:hypothetical protein n=1 Tax=Luteococcus sp. TaxID=1969402 RepID=UPI003735A1CC
MAALLLTREQIQLADRSGHAREELALQVKGFNSSALEDIDLELYRGEVLGLTGPARRGGMHQLAEALTGQDQEVTVEMTVGEAAVDPTSGVTGLGVAYSPPRADCAPRTTRASPAH